MAENQPGAKVSLADIKSELSDEMGRKMIPGYESRDFDKYVKLTPRDERTCAYVTPCCHLGPQLFTVTLNVTGSWLITDKGDDDEKVILTGYLEASGCKDFINLRVDGTDKGAGSSQLFVKTASVSFETETSFLVVVYLHEDCHTDGIIIFPPLTDAVSAIKITDIQVVIDTSQECKRKEATGKSKTPVDNHGGDLKPAHREGHGKPPQKEK